MNTNDATITLYPHSIPSFIEAEMERLYGHVFSSLALLRAYDAVGPDTHTYVARQDGRICAILLFRITGNRVQPLNEQMTLDPAEIARFTEYVFKTWPSVQIVAFHAVRCGTHRYPFLHQRTNVLEDIVVDLPASTAEYQALLGKATRKNIRHHLSRLQRSVASVEHRMVAGHEASEQDIRTIVGFNRLRMARKNKVSSLDDRETERLIFLVRQRGLLSLILIDGEVRAGAICTRIGANYFSHANAHDPAWDSFRLGFLCCYLTVCECIRRGGAEFHFLWGRYAYKYMLLGVHHEVQDVVLYRSPWHFLLCSGTALKLAAAHHRRNAKFWLLEKAQYRPGWTPLSKLLSQLLNGLRSLKQAAASFGPQRK